LRARQPDQQGYVDRAGVRVYYETFGAGAPAVLLLPTWSIMHSRHWKAQIHALARYNRVITFDPRGNGLSDRPAEPAAYADAEFVADALAVLDAVEVKQAIVVGFSAGCAYALALAGNYPERTIGAVFIGNSLPIAPPHAERAKWARRFDEVVDIEEGWAKTNRHYWLRDYQGYVAFFMAQMFPEPHSTKQIEDTTGWGLETTPEVLIATIEAPAFSEDEIHALASLVRCPVLVVHGTDDRQSPAQRAGALAEEVRGSCVILEGSGHAPHARDPVKINLLLREFIDSIEQPARSVRWHRGRSRTKRALYVSSPIGLGHARRDVAIAAELRRLVPGLEIDWLAQHPVTELLKTHGERIHPASAQLASESRHIEAESGPHQLHCFQAWRRMDEILVANFMVFQDVVSSEAYDVWIGDEAWEVDYYLHENPDLKRAAYAWLTDFVGWLPMPEGGEEEARLTADYNAEMIAHIARFPRIRDRAIFIGDPDDIVPDRFGADLPLIREWTEAHYDFSGYVTGFDPASFGTREGLRAEFGYAPNETICMVTVGGSGVGSHLLKRVTEAFPTAKGKVPNLRMIVVAGPRIDPSSVQAAQGLEVRAFVPDLHRHLAACDVALVQGGLTTTMELTAAGRPFIYFPLGLHFEQNFHVRHRLDRYRAGTCMDFETATPEVIAEAIVQLHGSAIDYRPVETKGAARAAELIASLF
jgi:Predicted hydrolases or acyltransferases (alpha/beta hydrolase superfamily)